MLKNNYDNLNQLISDIKLNCDLQDQEIFWILEKILNKSQASLLAKKSFSLSSLELNSLKLLLNKYKLENIPLQYLLGSVNFLNLKILVKSPILIPRSETEEWCDFLIKKFKKENLKNLKVLDLCSGSGCIGLAIAKEFKDFEVISSDISETACDLILENKELNKVKNLKVIKSDLFKNLKNYKFDILIANPPYISEKDYLGLDNKIKKWEDSRALVSGNDGLDLIRDIVLGSVQNNIDRLYIEIGHDQAGLIKTIAYNNNYKKVIIYKDFADKDRLAEIF